MENENRSDVLSMQGKRKKCKLMDSANFEVDPFVVPKGVVSLAINWDYLQKGVIILGFKKMPSHQIHPEIRALEITFFQSCTKILLNLCILTKRKYSEVCSEKNYMT